MLEEVDRLASLVDRLLMLSRAHLGEARLTVETNDHRALADEVVAHLGVLAEEKRQTLAVEAEGLPVAAADRLMLRQALINLADNAIKYTPCGGTIRVRVASVPGGAVVEVIDNGPGIADALRSRIFDRYYRASEAPTAGAAGAGLGLSIAKCAVELNGGHLAVETTPGGGSTFRIALPHGAGARAHGTRRKTA
jgi:signal transduction histidine kinase